MVDDKVITASLPATEIERVLRDKAAAAVAPRKNPGGVRRLARECALKFLFQCEFNGITLLTEEECAERFLLFCRHFPTKKQALPYARELIAGVNLHRPAIEELVRRHARNWRLERMSLVDRNILRLAVFELAFCADMPSRVAINEALEIAKLYGGDDSPSFINGILDAVSRGMPRFDAAFKAGVVQEPPPEIVV